MGGNLLIMLKLHAIEIGKRKNLLKIAKKDFLLSRHFLLDTLLSGSQNVRPSERWQSG